MKPDVAELKYMFFIPHAQRLHSSNLTSVHAKVQLCLLRICRFFIFLLFKIVILCTYFFSQSPSSSVADKFAPNCGEPSIGIPVGVGSQRMLLARFLLNNVGTILKGTISIRSSSEGSSTSFWNCARVNLYFVIWHFEDRGRVSRSSQLKVKSQEFSGRLHEYGFV